MDRIYLDNAATTPLDKEVLDAMLPYLTEKFGNPSSIYSYGRESKSGIENARKSIARILNVRPGEIFFTSGGTESTNTAITAAVRDLECRHIITSPIEHHATLHATEFLRDTAGVQLSFVKLLPDGHVDLNSLEALLKHSQQRCLVSLMHANNEIGNLLKIKATGELCKTYDAIFHCDTVQTLGHYPIDLQKIPVHFINGAAHKFHGPKGIGILYVNNDIRIKPLMHGGGQERNMRAGTENLYGIIGFAKALELAMAHYEEHSRQINELRMYMAEQLQQHISGVRFNGDLYGRSLYTILNASFPKTEKSELILFNLDMHNICVSGGSACTSGADQGSHVIRAIDPDPGRIPLRFSFSRYNTREEVDIVVKKLQELI